MKLLETKSLEIGYKTSKGSKVLQKDINVSLERGEIISVMGQNGVGKTTFLKSISGILPLISGTVNLGGKDIKTLSAHDLSQKISLVLTERPFSLNISVLELISIARHPYSNWMGLLSRQDMETIEWAITETHINYIANAKLYELSDGQLQKVMIARALAQETDLIFLDEPAAHLDLNNKIEVMLLLRKIASQGKGILISTHDMQISTQLSDKLWLFNFNDKIKEGTPEDLILDGTLEAALYLKDYGYDMIHGTINTEESGPEVSVSGEPNAKFWIELALKRNGFRITQEKSSIAVHCPEKSKYKLSMGGETTQHGSIQELLGVIHSKSGDGKTQN